VRFRAQGFKIAAGSGIERFKSSWIEQAKIDIKISGAKWYERKVVIVDTPAPLTVQFPDPTSYTGTIATRADDSNATITLDAGSPSAGYQANISGGFGQRSNMTYSVAGSTMTVSGGDPDSDALPSVGTSVIIQASVDGLNVSKKLVIGAYWGKLSGGVYTFSGSGSSAGFDLSGSDETKWNTIDITDLIQSACDELADADDWGLYFFVLGAGDNALTPASSMDFNSLFYASTDQYELDYDDPNYDIGSPTVDGAPSVLQSSRWVMHRMEYTGVNFRRLKIKVDHTALASDPLIPHIAFDPSQSPHWHSHGTIADLLSCLDS